MWPGASTRVPSCAAEPLFALLSADDARALRFRLSYRSGICGGVCDYAAAGAFPLEEALDVCERITKQERVNLDVLTHGIANACWGKPTHLVDEVDPDGGRSVA